ncbi:MAG: type II secretion system F family protein [Candidatus Diapherotrites archaeon]|uniref:Type II secretion system F family protein n=1 Tax=Candidatus Iainarchaeum sp. TaxID=3101447 RepID=A0A8T3YLD8_9ARCH|nr:type II secretion system F family protein [Candidatus Diapherotrites archaeon]
MSETHTLPGAPLPPRLMERLCYHFRGPGSLVARAFPQLGNQLKQADIETSKEIYGASVLVTSGFYFATGFLSVAILGLAISRTGGAQLVAKDILLFSVAIGAFAAIMSGLQVLLYPRIMLGKKVRDVERNLDFALRTILVESRSGVTLFDAINIVANGDNGQVSKEFRKAVRKISTGTFQNDALEELAENNPSLHFRRAIWQLVNGLKAGSDVNAVMGALVESISNEKANQVRKYGNSLKLLSLLYMMLGAILPALGLTMLIILSTFPQIKLGEEVFWGLLVMLAIGQFMFVGIIKNSRPSLLGD